MENKDIRELLRIIKQSGLEEVTIETKTLKLQTKATGETQLVTASLPAASVAPVTQVAAAPAPVPPVNEPAAETANPNHQNICSPIVGTFYRSSKPDVPAFVKEGDKVKKGQVLCIIEAMKLFNEIEAEVSGTIVKILIENATPVEYDQPLFVIDTPA